jgi:hypothetical protein
VVLWIIFLTSSRVFNLFKGFQPLGGGFNLDGFLTTLIGFMDDLFNLFKGFQPLEGVFQPLEGFSTT